MVETSHHLDVALVSAVCQLYYSQIAQLRIARTDYDLLDNS
jgi:hypothetical protein